MTTSGDLEVRWSQKDIVRVCENLLSNAVKYGDRGTDIVIEADRAGDRIEWSVHNWGNPLSAGDERDLFSFLRRSKSAREGDEAGWGIGLTLIRGIVEAHGGRISVSSELALGTRFAIDMPVSTVANG